MREIMRCFPNGKRKALTMSYDDGRESDMRLIDIFNKYNIKGTFHLNSGIIDNEESKKYDQYGRRIDISKIKEIYKDHEVACHTVLHVPLAELPLLEVLRQVVEDKKNLESVLKYPVRGMSYPYGNFNERVKEILKSAGIEYSRTVNDTHEFNIPDDFLEWNGTCRNTDDNFINFGKKFLELNTKNRLNIMYVWGHSYEFVRDNSWDKIEEFCSIMGNKSDIWYATNIEIVDYLKAWDNLKFSADGSFVYNPSHDSMWFIKDEKVYEIKGGRIVYL